MKKQIELNNRKIDYTLKVSRRAKHLRLTIYGGGELVVTAPGRFKESLTESFIREKTRWIIEKLEYFKRQPKRILLPQSLKDYPTLKKQALALAKERLEYFNLAYGFKYNRINIRRQKSRWGSCSKKGNLNFNYKIAYLPAPLADYIIVHELCHLKEFNHGAGFWRLVGEIVPDYMKVRKELKKFKL